MVVGAFEMNNREAFNAWAEDWLQDAKPSDRTLAYNAWQAATMFERERADKESAEVIKGMRRAASIRDSAIRKGETP